MSFSINTNVESLISQNYLQQSTSFQNQTISEVSSGLRIVNSGDDAAGLAVANGMRSDEAVLTQGIQNSNNGLATLQTIDGGMNNISTLLDRAATLAAESASGTFTGDRGTLNSEFQSVISEVSRQAQAIGMNQGGQFAQDLSVFVGGGKGATNAAASQNGSIGLNLTNATVDAQSLGLQGVQASGKVGTDIGTGSTTSVAAILGNSANAASEGTPGTTTFAISGPGFGDSNKVNLSVNLSGVTDANTLATAVNAAIQAAGNGTTQAATAFKNANISASIVTDSTGKEQLAFSASNTAFQVQAGDNMANALLGNFAQNATLQGADTSASVATTGLSISSLKVDGTAVNLSTATTTALAGGSVATSGGVRGLAIASDSAIGQLNGSTGLNAGDKLVLKVDGSFHTVTFQGGETTLGQIANEITSSNAGVTASVTGSGATQQLSLTSKTTGSNSNVSYEVTDGAGNTTSTELQGATILGFGNVEVKGTAGISGSVSTASSGSLTGTATATDAGIAAAGITSADQIVLNVNGTQKTIALNSSDVSMAALANTITTSNAGVTASFSALGALTLTSNATGSGSSISVVGGAGGTTAALLAPTVTGLTGSTSGGITTTGTATDATIAAAAITGSNQLMLNVDGTQQAVTLSTSDTTMAALAATITASNAGVTASFSNGTVAGSNVTDGTVNGLSLGSTHLDITLGGAGSPYVANLNTVHTTDTTLQDVADEINGQTGGVGLHGVTATVVNPGTNQTLLLTASNGESVTIANTSSANALSATGLTSGQASTNSGALTLTSKATGSTSTVAILSGTSANLLSATVLGVTVPTSGTFGDAGTIGSVGQNAAAPLSKSSIVNTLNADANFSSVATASLNGNQVVIQSNTNSANSSVQIAGTLASALGLSSAPSATATATAAAVSTGASLNTTVSGGGAVSNNAAIAGSILASTTIASSTAATQAILTSGAAPDTGIAALHSGAGTGSPTLPAVVTGTAVTNTSLVGNLGVVATGNSITGNTNFGTPTTGDSFTINGQTINLYTGQTIDDVTNTINGTAGVGVKATNDGSNITLTSTTLGTGGAIVLGGSNLADAGLDGTPTATAGSLGTNGTFDVKVNGVAQAVTINSNDTTLAQVVDDINGVDSGITGGSTTLNSWNTGLVTASIGTNNTLVLTGATGTGTGTLQVVSSPAPTHGLSLADLGLTTASSAPASTGTPGNNDTLVLNIDGTTHNFVIAGGDTTLASVVNDINNTTGLNSFNANSQLLTASIQPATSTTPQSLELKTNGVAGKAQSVTVESGTSTELLSALGLQVGNTASGSDVGTAATLSIAVGGSSATTISLDSGTYATGAALAAEINKQLTNPATAVAATASVDSAGHLILTANQPGQSLTVNSTDGSEQLGLTSGTAVTSNNALFTTADNIQVQFSGAGMSSPVTLALNQTVAGSTKVSDVVANLVSQVTANSQLKAAGISVSTSSDGNNLVFTNNKGEQFNVAVTGDTNNNLGFGAFATNASSSNAVQYSSIAGTVALPTSSQFNTASTGSLNISLNGGSSVANAINVSLKSTSGTVTGSAVTDSQVAAAGLTTGTDKLNVLVNGTSQTITLSTADTTLAKVAADINTQKTATGVSADIVTDKSGNQSLRLTAAGTGSSVAVEGVATGGTTKAALTATGLTAGQSNTGLASAALVQQDAISQINSQIGSNTALSAAGIQASLTATGGIELTSSNNTNFRVSGSGATDLGFGIGGGAYAGTAVSAAPTTGRADSAGAYTSASMNFAALAVGSDSQSVSITANDSSGAAHSISVTLQNSSTSTNGANIDAAVDSINTALQQSNDSTLQSVYAVKEDNADGTQSIKFMSTTQNFKIAVSPAVDGSGLASPVGGVSTSAQNGTGSSVSIDTISGAEAAVNAISAAVQTLGTAQAAVGKGENLLNYATSLAQSQNTNEAAAESQIRDANLAMEAANLTKAQILTQAGVAALAQANSAPQSLLKLLQ